MIIGYLRRVVDSFGSGRELSCCQVMLVDSSCRGIRFGSSDGVRLGLGK